MISHVSGLGVMSRCLLQGCRKFIPCPPERCTVMVLHTGHLVNPDPWGKFYRGCEGGGAGRHRSIRSKRSSGVLDLWRRTSTGRSHPGNQRSWCQLRVGSTLLNNSGGGDCCCVVPSQKHTSELFSLFSLSA